MSIRGQLEPIGKLLRLFPRANQLDNGKKLDVTVKLLLLLENKHKMTAKATLHHHPINGAGQGDIGGQEDNVFALERCDRLVNIEQVIHDPIQIALPLATGAGTGAVIGTEFARFLMRRLLIMQKGLVTAARVVFTRKVNRRRHLLHCQIANRRRLAAARWTVR